MTQPLKIRSATVQDVPALVALGERCFSEPWNAASFAEELRGPRARIWVALAGGVLAGYIAARFVLGECQILALAVAPDARRTGIANRLLGEALADSSQGPVVAAHLEVRRGNLGAQAFYRSWGFEHVGARAAYYPDGEDAILLSYGEVLDADPTARAAHSDPTLPGPA